MHDFVTTRLTFRCVLNFFKLFFIIVVSDMYVLDDDKICIFYAEVCLRNAGKVGVGFISR